MNTANPNSGKLNIILNVFYPPVDELKRFIELNSVSNGGMFVPVNGGSALKDEWSLKNMFMDSDGDDVISSLNPLLNELTSVYWYWKNRSHSEYVGFNHYRRIFDSSQILDFDAFDIIVSKPIYSNTTLSLAHQYAIYHVLSDLIACVNVMFDKVGSEWAKGFASYMSTSHTNLAPCNMYIMKRKLFDEWCSFIFPILFELKGSICSTEDFSKRDNYQKRALCFLTERIFNYWYYRKRESGLRTKEVDIVEHLDYKPSGVNERGDYSK